MTPKAFQRFRNFIAGYGHHLTNCQTRKPDQYVIFVIIHAGNGDLGYLIIPGGGIVHFGRGRGFLGAGMGR
ncbi:MAG: hypothetical protein BWY72_01380 [Bacteroidetes bacterium ADurb.Bin416]|nr:MAG: hypothetical protein BWY72_01380 [Bacteroidetes bacterium ADurb.Bin416]